MGKEVMQTITTILQEQGHLSPKEAMETFAELMKSRRYLADIW